MVANSDALPHRAGTPTVRTSPRPGVPLPSSADPTARILPLWRRLAPWPGGKALFSLLLGRLVPYSGTMRARIEALEPGHARIALADRRRVRNHLHSVHAVALTNLGELAGGLALITSLDPGVRAIVIRLETRFHHKARGRLTAECRVVPEAVSSETRREVRADIHDPTGTLVADVRATWLLRPPEAP